MNLFFTTSNKIGARVIRWGLGEDCSHLAIQFHDIVFHSVHNGCRVDRYVDFDYEVKILHSLRIASPLSREVEARIYHRLMDSRLGSDYDFKALAWWFFCGLGRKLFGMSLPSRNQWADRNDFLCVEVLKDVLAELDVKLDVDLAMTSPHRVFELLSMHPYFVVNH